LWYLDVIISIVSFDNVHGVRLVINIIMGIFKIVEYNLFFGFFVFFYCFAIGYVIFIYGLMMMVYSMYC
jgi:hypothetical protein